MNKEDIIRMAQEAGFCLDLNNGIYLSAQKHIEHFAELVAAAERHRLAKEAIDMVAFYKGPIDIAHAIETRWIK